MHVSMVCVHEHVHVCTVCLWLCVGVQCVCV